MKPCTDVKLYSMYIAKQKKEKFNYTSVRTGQSKLVSGNKRQAPQDGEKENKKEQEKLK